MSHQVGIRELKSRLSEYVARARSGESVVITQRGVPVARLEPLRSRLPAALLRLIEEGRAVDKGPLRQLPKPRPFLPGEKTSTDYVREQRR